MQNEMDLLMTISVVGCMQCVGCPECMALPVELPSLVDREPRIAQRMSELPQISESFSVRESPAEQPLMLFRDLQNAIQEEDTRSADSICSAGSTAD